MNGLANGTLVDARLAAYEYEALERAVAIDEAGRTPTKHWRDPATGFNRTALGAVPCSALARFSRRKQRHPKDDIIRSREEAHELEQQQRRRRRYHRALYY